MRLSGMVQHLATLGETVAEPKVVGKFLRSVPHKYKQIVVAIQTLLDVETLTLANVTGRLKAAEDELEAPPASVNHAGKLYLSEEAWEEKWKLREGSGASGSSGRGGGGGGRSAIVARVVATEMAGTTATPAIQLCPDWARWGVTSAASAAKRGTGHVIAGPSRRRRRRTPRKRKNP
jgi:hypothetical protein